MTFAGGSLAGDFGAGSNLALSLTTSPLILGVPGTTGAKYYVESLVATCSISTEFPTDSTKMITTTSSNTNILLVPAGTVVSVKIFFIKFLFLFNHDTLIRKNAFSKLL